MPYAHATQTPEAHHLQVVDLATGADLKNVIEVNTEEGWLRRSVIDVKGKLVLTGDCSEFAIERIEGEFRIDFTPDSGQRREWRPTQWSDSKIWSEF